MNPMKSIQQALHERWFQVQHERLLKRATLATYANWAKRHPEWVVGFFDEHFVAYHIVPLVHEAFHQQRAVDPLRLVELWANQFHFSPAQRQLRTHTLLPAVVDFLKRLKVELIQQEVNHPIWLATWLEGEWSVAQPQCARVCQK